MNVVLFQYINQLWKRRRNVNALLVHHPFDALPQHLLNTDRKVVPRLPLFHFI